MSLVAAYGDSDSENSNDSSDFNENAKTTSTQDAPIQSSSEDEEERKAPLLTSLTTQETKGLPPTADKLPVPGFLAKAYRNNTSQSNNGHLPTTSVFSNPFVEAERAKKLTLEKHVKMVDCVKAVSINGKKVCWNYRKGRCRFGHNCKFAHDSDLQKSTSQLAAENQIQETVLCQSDNAGPPLSRANAKNGRNFETNDSISDEETNNGIKNIKRKRPGLSQGLQPGKKVLKQYQKLKNHH